jgi:hypothetical protein
MQAAKHHYTEQCAGELDYKPFAFQQTELFSPHKLSHLVVVSRQQCFFDSI